MNYVFLLLILLYSCGSEKQDVLRIYNDQIMPENISLDNYLMKKDNLNLSLDTFKFSHLPSNYQAKNNKDTLTNFQNNIDFFDIELNANISLSGFFSLFHDGNNCQIITSDGVNNININLYVIGDNQDQLITEVSQCKNIAVELGMKTQEFVSLNNNQTFYFY